MCTRGPGSAQTTSRHSEDRPETCEEQEENLAEIALICYEAAHTVVSASTKARLFKLIHQIVPKDEKNGQNFGGKNAVICLYSAERLQSSRGSTLIKGHFTYTVLSATKMTSGTECGSFVSV